MAVLTCAAETVAANEAAMRATPRMPVQMVLWIMLFVLIISFFALQRFPRSGCALFSGAEFFIGEAASLPLGCYFLSFVCICRPVSRHVTGS